VTATILTYTAHFLKCVCFKHAFTPIILFVSSNVYPSRATKSTASLKSFFSPHVWWGWLHLKCFFVTYDEVCCVWNALCHCINVMYWVICDWVICVRLFLRLLRPIAGNEDSFISHSYKVFDMLVDFKSNLFTLNDLLYFESVFCDACIIDTYLSIFSNFHLSTSIDLTTSL
jgi:hypothetical protein